MHYRRDSESLAIRLKWDLTILEHILKEFPANERLNGLDEKVWILAKEHLEKLSEELRELSKKVESCSNKFQKWIKHARTEKLERELLEWT